MHSQRMPDARANTSTKDRTSVGGNRRHSLVGDDTWEVRICRNEGDTCPPNAAECQSPIRRSEKITVSTSSMLHALEISRLEGGEIWQSIHMYNVYNTKFCFGNVHENNLLASCSVRVCHATGG